MKAKANNHGKNAHVADVEVLDLQAVGRRVATDKKSILRFLAATGMYTASGKLKPQFR